MSGARPGAEGRLAAVCAGPGGIPKHPLERAVVGPLGLEGDGHRQRSHGGRDRAVCLLSVEDYRALAAEGVACERPGTFGENLLSEGLDLAALRPGDRLAVGPEVRLELHDVRAPCATLRPLDPRFPDLMVGRSGFVCRVLAGGEVAPGMPIRVEAGAPGPAAR